MTWILIGLLVVAAIVIVVMLAQRNQGSVPSGPAPKSPSRPAVQSAVPAQHTYDEDDEATTVKVVGHRLVRVTGGVSVGDPFPLGASTSIGRDKACGITLSDPEISSVHAEITIDHDRAFISDRNSTNGTVLNDDRLPAYDLRPLQDGDRIKVGAITLMYKVRP